MTTDPDWITINPIAGRFPLRRRRSIITGFGMMDSTIGSSARAVPYVEINGHSIPVKETEAQLAELLGAQL